MNPGALLGLRRDSLRAAEPAPSDGQHPRQAQPILLDAFALARCLLAGATLLTLGTHSAVELFSPLGRTVAEVSFGGPAHFSLFGILRDQIQLAHALAIGVLLLVISGWRPRWTGLAHWYVSASVFSSMIPADGGEQVNVCLTFLLVPLCLLDSRRSHWQASASPDPEARRIARDAFDFLIRLQVAAIYLHAALGKLGVPEWRNGTAIYYIFTDPVMGAPAWLEHWLTPLLLYPPLLLLLNWGAVTLELFLGTAICATPRTKRVLLVLGLLFHTSIAVVHGLVTFGMSMFAALALYLLPIHQPLSLSWPGSERASRLWLGLQALWRSLSSRARAARAIG